MQRFSSCKIWFFLLERGKRFHAKSVFFSLMRAVNMFSTVGSTLYGPACHQDELSLFPESIPLYCLMMHLALLYTCMQLFWMVEDAITEDWSNGEQSLHLRCSLSGYWIMQHDVPVWCLVQVAESRVPRGTTLQHILEAGAQVVPTWSSWNLQLPVPGHYEFLVSKRDMLQVFWFFLVCTLACLH